MHKVSACVLLGAVAISTLSPSPSRAFGLQLGPFSFGIPFFGHPGGIYHRRHAALHHSSFGRHAIYDRANPNDLGGRDPRSKHTASGNPLSGNSPMQGANPALLYPNLALPSVYQEVFWLARAAPWGFGYDAIVRTAFDKSRPEREALACQRPDPATGIVQRIAAEVRPNAEQKPLLEKLGAALAMASGALARACPPQLPPQPVARLQVIQSQLQALTLAIDLVRPPLEQFTRSLSAAQLARSGADSPATATSGCRPAPTPTGWSIDEIDRSIQPADDLRGALTDLRQAFTSAAQDIDAHCPAALPATPLDRLEAIEARLDASWRATLAMQVALKTFEASLNDQQRGRFDAMNMAQAQ
jgi:hypothetical protein